MKSVKIFFIPIFLILFLFSNQNYSQSETSAIAIAKPYLEKSNDPSSVKVITFEDDMNGDNSVAGLEARGWVIIDADGGGFHPAWFQGNLFEDRFNAYDGTSNDYVASDWQGDTNSVVDHWLITPTIIAGIGDIFSYWVRSGSDYNDSLSVYISDDKTMTSDFNYITNYFVDTLGWVEHGVEITGIPSDGKIRFAFRYNINNTILNGDYIGIDLIQMTSSSIGNLPTVVTNDATNIGTTTATLNGTINPNGLSTTYSFSYGTTTSYDNFELSFIELTGNNPINVDINISNLTPNTIYHFQLSAENSAGTINGDDVTFTTDPEGNPPPIATTNAATNIGTTTATINGTINPNGSATSYLFEYGTNTSYGNTVTSTNDLTGSSDINVNADINDLTPNNTYHFRLSATNEGGTTVSADATFTTNSSTTGDIDLQWRTLSVSSFDWEVGNSMNANLMVKNYGTDASTPHQSQLFISTDRIIESTDIALGNQIQFPEIPAGDSVTISSNFTVPLNTNGIYYFGAIVDINNSISETNENNNSNARLGKIVIGYPNTLQLSSTVNFNDASLSSSFRMVGLPGNVNQSISELLTGNYNEDWVAYYDNGNNTDYLVSYDGSNTFNFSPGKGFWVLSKNTMNTTRSVSAVTIENNYTSSGTYEIVYPINLQNGWNIISNPFETDVSWNTVQSINLISESIHSFNGSFSSSSVMQPYIGYYFYNVTNLTSLQIPYVSSSNLAKSDALVNMNEQFLEVSATNKKDQISAIRIGFDQDAKSGYDKFDHFIPPGDFEDIRISILNQQIETPYKYLQIDYREYDKNQSYDIIVKNKTSDLIELHINGISWILAEAIYLVDNNLTFHNLRSAEKIVLKSSKEKNDLKLLIGDYEYIEMNRKLLLPKSFSLSQNYPNPFNPSTTIKYTIPRDEKRKTIKVKLVVYDILGREVQLLVNENQKPGDYEVVFNSHSGSVRNLTSGIYFYRLQAGDPSTSSGQGFVETQKMLMIK